MLNFTPEERKVVLFLLSLAIGGVVLNNLVKVNCRIEGMIYPQIQLARLDLNKISLAELMETKRVPFKLAQAIIEYRSFHKVFGSLEELKEVKGVGEARYEKLKELFFVE